MTGTVAAGGSATGGIQFTGERDWFAVTLVAGKAYRIDLEGSHTGAGTLRDPYLHGIHDANGTLIDGTANDDRSWWALDSQVTFTPNDDRSWWLSTARRPSRRAPMAPIAWRRAPVATTCQVSVTADGDGM